MESNICLLLCIYVHLYLEFNRYLNYCLCRDLCIDYCLCVIILTNKESMRTFKHHFHAVLPSIDACTLRIRIIKESTLTFGLVTMTEQKSEKITGEGHSTAIELKHFSLVRQAII